MQQPAKGRLFHAACWLIVVAASLASAGKARAEWLRFSDSVVWSDVGVLYEFRIARTSDKGDYHTFVIDCDGRSALPALTGEQGDDVLDGTWFDVKAHTVGEQITTYACERQFEETGRWLASLDPKIHYDQWSQVGELGDLRLTWIKRHDSQDREVWLARCSDSAIIHISSIESGKKFLINGHWNIVSERGDRSMVEFACGNSPWHQSP
jgi:hypothetical protein